MEVGDGAMGLNEKFTAIANSIRAKTGKTEKLTLDQMVTEINSISTSEDFMSALGELHEMINLEQADPFMEEDLPSEYVDESEITCTTDILTEDQFK